MPPQEDRHAIVQSWDTAVETGSTNDYSVCTTWCVSPSGLYLMDVYRKKLEVPDLMRKAEAHANQFRANQILIEKAASGNALYQNMRRQLKTAQCIAVSPVTDKEARLRTCSHMFENGLVKLPVEAEWLGVYRHELLGFPAGRHDDQVDSTSQFLNYIAGKTVGAYRFDADGKTKRVRRPDMRKRRPQYGNWLPPANTDHST